MGSMKELRVAMSDEDKEALFASWREEDHPRDGGKFAPKEGSEAHAKKHGYYGKHSIGDSVKRIVEKEVAGAKDKSPKAITDSLMKRFEKSVKDEKSKAGLRGAIEEYVGKLGKKASKGGRVDPKHKPATSGSGLTRPGKTGRVETPKYDPPPREPGEGGRLYKSEGSLIVNDWLGKIDEASSPKDLSKIEASIVEDHEDGLLDYREKTGLLLEIKDRKGKK